MARIHHATLAKAKKFGITLTLDANDVVATDKKGTQLASGLQGNKVLEEAITKLTGKEAKGSDAKAPKAAKVLVPQPGHRYTDVFAKTDPKTILEDIDGHAEEMAEEDETTVAVARAKIVKMFETNLDEYVDLLGDRVEEMLEDLVGDDEEGAAEPKSVVKAKYKKLYQPHKHKNGDELGQQISAHVTRENADGEMQVNLAALRKFAKANGCWVESYASLKSRTGGWNSGMARMNVANRLRAKVRKDPDFVIQWV